MWAWLLTAMAITALSIAALRAIDRAQRRRQRAREEKGRELKRDIESLLLDLPPKSQGLLRQVIDGVEDEDVEYLHQIRNAAIWAWTHQ